MAKFRTHEHDFKSDLGLSPKLKPRAIDVLLKWGTEEEWFNALSDLETPHSTFANLERYAEFSGLETTKPGWLFRILGALARETVDQMYAPQDPSKKKVGRPKRTRWADVLKTADYLVHVDQLKRALSAKERRDLSDADVARAIVERSGKVATSVASEKTKISTARRKREQWRTEGVRLSRIPPIYFDGQRSAPAPNWALSESERDEWLRPSRQP